jgi:hypothetical protein
MNIAAKPAPRMLKIKAVNIIPTIRNHGDF